MPKQIEICGSKHSLLLFYNWKFYENYCIITITCPWLLLYLEQYAEECCKYFLNALLKQIDHVTGKQLEDVAESLTERSALAEQIRAYIDHKYMEDVSLQSMAKELNISRYYLSHIFKEFYGYSPMQYMLRRRIGEAQSLLIGTDYTVTRIATLVGYDNPNHFNTIFSKNVGISPRNYRVLYQSKEEEELSYTVM